MTCTKAKRGRRRAEFVTCSIDGRRLRTKVADRWATCERWPDRFGRVRWLGLTWRGVPAPRRWVLEARGYLRTSELFGCGCIDALKRAAEWVAARTGRGDPARSDLERAQLP